MPIREICVRGEQRSRYPRQEGITEYLHGARYVRMTMQVTLLAHNGRCLLTNMADPSRQAR
jgi:hypothetical protein